MSTDGITLDRISEELRGESRRRLKRALGLLRIARKDLEATKVLLKAECYPQAIFMCQQMCEKVCEAIMLHLGFVDEKDLARRIRHKVFREGIKAIHEHFRKELESSLELSSFANAINYLISLITEKQV
ncbi:MAG: hypothetical protein DRN15_07235 [Thermoprotei archaeon]|nr:MAG: hypothetical protein DRN15_07235 [Thermoprotei archaeon]